MEAFIRFIIQHNEKLVYISGGVICLLSAIIVWWQVFGKKGLNTGDKPEVDFSGIEETLKRILSQTHVVMQNVEGGAGAVAGATGPGAGPAAVAGSVAASAEVVALKKELETRVKMVEQLQVQVAAAKGGDNTSELLAKIKNLEGKLAEYEIIEDDIADLSNFKEENARLKKELDAIKRGGPQLVDQFADAINAAQASTTPGTVVIPADDTPIAPAAPAPAPAAAANPADVVAAAQASVGLPDDLLAAASAGPEEQVLDFAAAPAAPAAAPATAPTPATEAEAPKGDIFGEFSGGESAESDPLAALGDIDPDKMLDELKDLNSDLNIGAEALEETPDIDKMAQEAESLEKKG